MSQSAEGKDEPLPFLSGPAAAQWFHALPGGGTVLDAHVLAIQSVFGPDVLWGYRAAAGFASRQSRTLIIEIGRSIDDADACEALIRVQEILLEQQQDLVARSGRRRPFHNIVLSLALPPGDWEAILNDAERAD